MNKRGGVTGKERRFDAVVNTPPRPLTQSAFYPGSTALSKSDARPLKCLTAGKRD